MASPAQASRGEREVQTRREGPGNGDGGWADALRAWETSGAIDTWAGGERASPPGGTEGAQPTHPEADFWAPEPCGAQHAPIRPLIQQLLNFLEEEGWYSDVNRGDLPSAWGMLHPPWTWDVLPFFQIFISHNNTL